MVTVAGRVGKYVLPVKDGTAVIPLPILIPNFASARARRMAAVANGNNLLQAGFDIVIRSVARRRDDDDSGRGCGAVQHFSFLNTFPPFSGRLTHKRNVTGSSGLDHRSVDR